MSGHSKWNNIKRKKEKTDGARAKVFTKIGREISVAVRMGGPNPASNSKLADLIAKAKRMSVPNDNIQRIIKKAEGGDKTEYEAITYEGYGPGGVAVMVETLTDNRNRTAADLRHYFDKNGGNLGAMGCVAFLFSQKGVIDISLEDKDADEAMMDALDAGAEDFDASEDAAEITTEHSATRPKLSSAAWRSPRIADTPTPSAMIKGTVMGPVVTPPESKATARNSRGTKAASTNTRP